MLRATRKTARTALRIAMLVAVMVGPIGAFALAHAGSEGRPDRGRPRHLCLAAARGLTACRIRKGAR
jgi:hypothetical protein